MTKNKVLLLLQSLICVLVVVMLIIGAMRIYREGIAVRVVDPRADIYTTDSIKNAVAPVFPVIVCGLMVTAAGWLLGIRDERYYKPVYDIEMERPLVVGSDYGKSHKKLRIMLLVVAIGLIVAGIYNGSMKDVLNKAVRICSECIGLG